MSVTSFRILAMNVENLFSPGESFYGSEYTPEEYEIKLDWIGTLIAYTGAHVVGLTEIGEDAGDCIRDIMARVNEKDRSGLPPFSHEFRATPGAGFAAIRTAVISRFCIDDAESIVDFPDGFQVDFSDYPADRVVVPVDRFSRPVSRVRIRPPGGNRPMNVFVVHLKSKRPMKSAHDGYNEAIGIARSAVRRNVEAAALRCHLDQFLPNQYDADPDIPTFLLGDFNDVPTSVPLENIRGPFDKVPGPASQWSEPDKRRLLNCARLHHKLTAHEDKLFSYVHNENFTLIDQIFVTEHLVSRFVRMEIYNDHVFRHNDMSSPTAQEQQWKSMVSDHGAVLAEFNRMLYP